MEGFMAAPVSRLIANWLYTRPGPIYAETPDDVLEEALKIFSEYCGKKPEDFDLAQFGHTFEILGYKPTQRRNFGPTPERPLEYYWVLALPERSVMS
jgi:hypothetical protein